MRSHMLALIVSLARIVSAEEICFGGTMYGMTPWKQYSNGVVVKVDTSACKFKKTPVIVTGLSGWSDHWTSVGGSSVYSDTKNGYTDYVYQKGIKSAIATSWGWTTNFLATMPGKSNTGICAGSTPQGSTKWVKYTNRGLYADVDTSTCGFSKTPVYKTSLGGRSGNWQATGTSSVYKATKKGFRIYVYWFGGNIPPSKARGWRWHIKWIAHPVGSVSHPGGKKTCAGMTSHKVWHAYKPAKGKGIYADVVTGCKFWGATPRYVTAVAGTSHHWKAMGVSEAYSPTATGFRVYLWSDSGISPAKAKKWSWHVQWIAAAAAPRLCSGGTPKGRTRWSKYGNHGITSVVSTEACGMLDRPVYVASMGGTGNHWLSKGSSAIYADTWKSFQTYIYRQSISVRNANKWNWHMNFLAFPAGKSKSGICAGETVPGATSWKQYHSTGLYVDVDTSMCGFSQTPVYKSSIGGASHHWVTQGSSAIYFSSKNKFRVYIYQPKIKAKQAIQWKWHIKWVAHPKGEVVLPGGSKSCAGISSQNAWKVYARDSIYTDVKTGCKVAEGTPRYVTAVSGKSGHWTAYGVSEPYHATADGFRLYLQAKGAGMIPAKAAKWGWKVSWIAAGTTPKTPVPTPAPKLKRVIKGGGWAVAKGNCRIDARVQGRPCLKSPNFPGKYTAEESCVLKMGKKTTHVVFERFNTEKWFDYVEIGKARYSGVVKPNKVVKLADPKTITWSSDFFEEGKGWTICKAKAPRLKVVMGKKKGRKRR